MSGYQQRMELEKTFVSIVETGSLSKTAELFGAANSTISTRLKTLEKKLGAQLLQRTARGIQLTEVGRCYFDQIQSALAIASEAEAAVKKMAAGDFGRLNIHIPPGLIEHWLAEPVAQFLHTNPQVSLSITTSDDILPRIHAGFDVCFHWGQLPDSSVYAQKLFDDEVLVVASETYIRDNKIYESPENIEFLQLTREFAGGTKRAVAPREEIEWFYSHPSRITTDNVEAQIALLAYDVAAAVLPKSYLLEMLAEGVIQDITHLYFAKPHSMTCFAVTAEKPSRQSRSQHLIDRIKAYYS